MFYVHFKSDLQIVENVLYDRSKTELSIVIFALGKLWGRSGTISMVWDALVRLFVRSRRSFVLSFAASFVRSFVRWGAAVTHPYFL